MVNVNAVCWVRGSVPIMSNLQNMEILLNLASVTPTRIVDIMKIYTVIKAWGRCLRDHRQVSKKHL